MIKITKGKTAYLAGGCFWCVEAVFVRIKGVKNVVPGYMGGQISNPSYLQVCSGNSGHAEVIKISFDEALISYDQLLDVFFLSHDPTTKDRQGNDVGSQYRSAVFYVDESQKRVALQSIKKHQLQFAHPIVTEVSLAKKFYLAEEYHHDYYQRNPRQPYCRFVISEKLKKLKLG